MHTVFLQPDSVFSDSSRKPGKENAYSFVTALWQSPNIFPHHVSLKRNIIHVVKFNLLGLRRNILGIVKVVEHFLVVAAQPVLIIA